MKEYFDKVKGAMEAEKEMDIVRKCYYDGYVHALFDVGYLSTDEFRELGSYKMDLLKRYLQP